MILSIIFTLAATVAMPTQAEANVQAEKYTQTVGELNHQIAVKESNVEVLQVRRGRSDGLGFVDKYLPFSLDRNLNPEVEDNLAVMWIVDIIFSSFFAPIWTPLVFTDLKYDRDHLVTQIIAYFLHGATTLICLPIMCPANILYLGPVASLNIASRHARGIRRRSRRGRRYDDDRGAMLNLPNMPQVKTAAYSY